MGILIIAAFLFCFLFFISIIDKKVKPKESNFDKQKREHKEAEKAESMKSANSNNMFKQNTSMEQHLSEYLTTEEARRSKDYKEYLKTMKWYDLCTLVYVRDGYRCRQCFKDLSKRNGNVHHTNYDNIFKETIDDLVLLCPKCHTMVHYYYDKRFPLSLKKPLTQIQYLEVQEMMNIKK